LRTPPVTDLKVDSVLRAKPAVRETAVRTIAPAAIFVVEVDGPIRLVTNTLSRGESAALLSWMRSNPDACQFAAAYSDARTELEGGEDFASVERELAHERLLERGVPLPIEGA